jgi:hypothetical protein
MRDVDLPAVHRSISPSIPAAPTPAASQSKWPVGACSGVDEGLA